MSGYAGVILAAGRASRIAPLDTVTQKALLTVGDRPIVLHQIAQLRAAGVRQVHVVVGHHREHVVALLGDGSAHGVEVTYAEQDEPLGIAHALSRVADRVTTPFFLMLGDIYSVFSPSRSLRDLVALRERHDAAAVLTVSPEPDEDVIRRNFAVSETGGRVTRVEEKPAGPLDTGLRGCGIYLFGPDVFDAIDRTPRSALRGEYEITDTIGILVDSGAPVHCTRIIDWDMNMTFPEDLLHCNLHYLGTTGREVLVGEGVELHPGCEVRRSVLGAGVTVRRPIAIRDSFVFPGTVVTSEEDIVGSVVSPAGVFVRRPEHWAPYEAAEDAGREAG